MRLVPAARDRVVRRRAGLPMMCVEISVCLYAAGRERLSAKAFSRMWNWSDPGWLIHLEWESCRPQVWAGRLDEDMAARKRHTPEQVVRKLATADRMMGEGRD